MIPFRGFVALAFLCAPAMAQSGTSGARDTFSTARALPAAGGVAASASFVAEATISQAVTGPVQLSSNYAFSGGVAWVGEEFAPTGPVVFGTEIARGDKDGGYAATVFGRNFSEPGAGPLTLRVAGTPATNVTLGAGNDAGFVMPTGVDALGNGLGAVDIEAETLLGARTAKGAFTYTPALVGGTPPVVGSAFTLHEYAAPFELQDLYFGVSIPGVGLPLPPVDGAFALLALFFSTNPSLFSTSDATTWNFGLPANPSLVGKSLEFQAYSFDSLTPVITGAFTNVHTITIQG